MVDIINVKKIYIHLYYRYYNTRIYICIIYSIEIYFTKIRILKSKITSIIIIKNNNNT